MILLLSFKRLSIFLLQDLRESYHGTIF